MNFLCQQSALSELQNLAENQKHSILIEGPEGCGKTYLAAVYSKLLGISNFSLVDPNVQAIRECMDECRKVGTPVVICIENLDLGVIAASYTLLKFLEEPTKNVYIVVTCRNLSYIPDTIISRSVCVCVSPPIDSDIQMYSIAKAPELYNSLKNTTLWSCVRTFRDADTILGMKQAQLDYFNELTSITRFTDSVSNLVWKISHYEDNTETPIELVIMYISKLCGTNHIQKAAISCIQDINSGRIATHAAISRFMFECKYCE